MNLSRPTSAWLPISGLLLVVVGALGWLLLGFAGNREGRTPLPDSQGSTVEFFVDRGRQLSVEKVRALSVGAWRTWAGGGAITSNQGDDLWLRITVRNPGDRALTGVLENDDFFADRVEVWIEDAEAVAQAAQAVDAGVTDVAGGKRPRSEMVSTTDGPAAHPYLSGEAVDNREKLIAGREVAWPLNVPAKGERVVLMRVSNFFTSYAAPVWWSEKAAFDRAVLRSAQAEGIYLGGLLALLGYNILLWLRLRAKDIGFYVLYLGTAAGFMFLTRAQGPALGWAFGSPMLENALVTVIALNGLFLTQFARVFLETKAILPRGDRWLNVWSMALLLPVIGAWVAPSWPWLDWLHWIMPAVSATHATLLVLAVIAWRAGVRQARYFVLSFGCLFAGLLPMLIVWFSNDLLRDIGMKGVMIGSALEMLLLSIAVADRFALAQRKLVEETEQRRMIEEAYADELEVEVRERTQELRAANADKDRMLAVIGHDLRSPLTGLMRAADGASGEFARDAGRTGRELLLMIEDLVQWARLRAGGRLSAVHRASALAMPAVALHHALAEADGVELVVEVPETLRVETDLVLAQTLVRNLLANALKFAETRVVLRATEDDAGGVVFTVSNDGPELPAAVAARLAAGADGPLTATGGMGLRLCREICRALDLRLEAGASHVGSGAEFRFTLKKAADAATEAGRDATGGSTNA